MTDTSGLIDPSQFVAKSAGLDPSVVRDSARSARAMGKAADDETRAINTTWLGLGAHYEAPEQQQVYDVMRPAVTSAGDLKNTFGSMAAYLDTYAAALDGIKARLSDFEGRAAAFRASVVGGVQVDASEAKDAGFGDFVVGMFDWVPGVDESQVTVPWYEDSDTVQKNKDLLGEYAQILADISTASSQCANDINRLVEHNCVAVVEAIPAEAFTNPEQPMPWGAPRDEDRNCPESVGHGAYTFGADIAQGAGMLVLGYNPESGDFFDGSSYGQAWGGFANLVGSIVDLDVALSSPGRDVAAGMAVTGNTDNEFVRVRWTSVPRLSFGGLGSLVGYDINAEDGWHKWKEDGVAAATGSVLSIGTFFIPGVGEVGAGLKAGSMGAKVARIAAVTADVAVQGGGWLVKGGLRVATGLRGVLRFGDDVLPTAERAGAAARISPTALIAAVDDLPVVHVTPPRPVSVELFGPSRVDPSGTSVLEQPVARVDSSAEHLDGAAHHVDPPAGVKPAQPVDPPAGVNPAQPVDPPAGHVDPPAQHVDPARGPVWSGDTLADGRPDVSTVPQADWTDPRVDPSSLHYDGTPRGDHGNVGTLNPDELSPSGLTNNGRLIDPTVVPPELQHYVDAGVIVNDDGVLRLHRPGGRDVHREEREARPGRVSPAGRPAGAQPQPAVGR